MTGEFPYWSLRVAEVLLWGSFGAVVYSYFVYPLLVALIVRVFGTRPVVASDGYLPTVSVVISLYNEEVVLPDKLRNLDATDYPPDRIRFVFGSDGSTDATNSILAGWAHPGKEVITFSGRRGKGLVLNDLVRSAASEVVVFSDANTIYEPGTVRMLVRLLADPAVGAVCGKLVLRPEGTDLGGGGEVSYWSYENWLKRNESDRHTLLGATGGVYAIRRALYMPLPDHKSVADDFLIPMNIVRKGYRVIYAQDAVAYERTSGSMIGEFRRKARIGAQNFAGIPEFASLLGPSAGFTAFALWSHKIIRWVVPFLSILALAATAVLASVSLVYGTMLVVEIAFIALGAAGFVADRTHVQLGIAGLPYYVLAMNAALLVGFFRYVLHRQKPTWEVLR